MNWKEFFKPTKKKIIISLIFIIVIEVFAYLFGYSFAIMCEPCGSPPAYCPPCVSPETGFSLALITLIPAIVVVYLMVSLVSYIFRNKPN